MKRFCLYAAVLLAVMSLVPLIGCILLVDPAGGPDSEPTSDRSIPDEWKESARSAVESANNFAFDLYGELEGGEGNIFFSPYSVFTALSMTLAGARGETEQETVDALCLDEWGESLHPACGALFTSLNRGSGVDYQLSISNRLWGASGYPFLESFLSTLDLHYSAGFEEMDFMRNPSGARLAINSWVEEQTEEKIVDLLPPGAITTDTRLVLTNAIYFLADWLYQFDSADTREAPFHGANGAVSALSLMHQEGKFRHAHVNDFQLVEMPYKGEDLSMVVLLPDDPEGLDDLESVLSWSSYREWTGLMYEQDVKLWFPTFEFTTQSFSLKPALMRLGMVLPFSDRADFSGIVEGGGGLFISDVIQKAFIKVNEEGTEAAAATGVIFGITSVRDDIVFRADHPFIYLIQDRVTGAVLFIGRFSTP